MTSFLDPDFDDSDTSLENVDVDDYEVEDPFPCRFCGALLEDDDHAFQHEYECPRQESFWMKGILPEGDSPLEDVAQAAAAFAYELQRLHHEGYEITMHDNGHLHLGKPLSDEELKKFIPQKNT
jgi:hypothetical protein